jgi:hypothetical protein
MRFAFQVRQVPEDPSGYRAVACTEGNLVVEVGGDVFVRFEALLLVEFASAARNWLKSVDDTVLPAFYFASMDEEEEPLFAMSEVEAGVLECHSVWQQSAAKRVSVVDATSALRAYIADLTAALSTRGVDLNDTFRWLDEACDGGRA